MEKENDSRDDKADANYYIKYVNMHYGMPNVEVIRAYGAGSFDWFGLLVFIF
jgi:hypothetical protein